MDNRDWLIENASIPIRYILTQDLSLKDSLLDNDEVKLWLSKLSDRVADNNLADIHGSHDYRYENIIGKCFILGLNKNILEFDSSVKFFIDFLNQQINKVFDEKLTFGKMYQYRDYETIISCYMPFLGYGKEPCVEYVAKKRINIVYDFAKQKRYDIYCKDMKYPGATKSWIPYIIDPELYKDGNISVPSIHDFILFAGIYPYLEQDMKQKVETIVKWLLDERYSQLKSSYYYYAPYDPSYKSKRINSKITLLNLNTPNFQDNELLYQCFIFSHFEEIRKCEWFSRVLFYLDQYKTENGRFVFPRSMIDEKADTYVYKSSHMNVGESKRNKNYAEIISTYWMNRIEQNCCI